MAKLGVELVVVVAVFLGSSQTLQMERCPRASPEELWYSDYSPMLQNTCLEGCPVHTAGRYFSFRNFVFIPIEMSYYFRLIYGRLEDGHLFTFIPHIKEDPE